MRVHLLVIFGCFTLFACSPPRTEPREIGYVEPYDFGTQTAYDVAEGLGADYIPDEFRFLSLPSASGASMSLYAIVSYRDFRLGETPRGYHGANTSELLAFMGKYGTQLDGDYVSICAPTGFFSNSVQMMATATKVTEQHNDDPAYIVTRYGTRLKSGKGCNWALILQEEIVPTEH